MTDVIYRDGFIVSYCIHYEHDETFQKVKYNIYPVNYFVQNSNRYGGYYGVPPEKLNKVTTYILFDNAKKAAERVMSNFESIEYEEVDISTEEVGFSDNFHEENLHYVNVKAIISFDLRWVPKTEFQWLGLCGNHIMASVNIVPYRMLDGDVTPIHPLEYKKKYFMMDNFIPESALVRYVPDHACGDPEHPDCVDGELEEWSYSLDRYYISLDFPPHEITCRKHNIYISKDSCKAETSCPMCDQVTMIEPTLRFNKCSNCGKRFEQPTSVKFLDMKR